MSAINIRVIGNVQGVCFRADTKTQADTLNLTGWVRNNLDGSVEIHAEGEQGALQELEKWCHTGPETAEVTEVIVEEATEDHTGEFVIIA